MKMWEHVGGLENFSEQDRNAMSMTCSLADTRDMRRRRASLQEWRECQKIQATASKEAKPQTTEGEKNEAAR